LHISSKGQICNLKWFFALIAGCTHFDWSLKNGGTCTLRESAVQRGDAKSSEIPGVRCGIVKEVSLDFNLLIQWKPLSVNTANVVIRFI
jgi:hypothetical protein